MSIPPPLINTHTVWKSPWNYSKPFTGLRTNRKQNFKIFQRERAFFLIPRLFLNTTYSPNLSSQNLPLDYSFLSFAVTVCQPIFNDFVHWLIHSNTIRINNDCIIGHSYQDTLGSEVLMPGQEVRSKCGDLDSTNSNKSTALLWLFSPQILPAKISTGRMQSAY